MRITVVIPVHDDPQIVHCVNSIDEDVEIILVLNNATNEDLYRCKKIIRAKTVIVDRASLPGAYNFGINIAKNSKVILMNADCWFKPGSINLINKQLDNNILVRGKVNFLYQTKCQQIVARTRHMHTNGRRAFAPPLGIKKSKKLQNENGEYFNSNLPWTEDYEFDQRRRINNISVYYEQYAQIFHENINMKTDLKSAFKYGQGQSVGRKLHLQGYGKVSLSIGKILKVYKVVRRIFDKKTALYFCCWNIFFYAGFKRGAVK